MAEKTGPIVEIGDWALSQACRDATRWPDEIKVTVNLSRCSSRTAILTERSCAALADSGPAGHRASSSRSPKRCSCATRADARDPGQAARARRQHRARRFRHGIRLALLSAQLRLRQDQDRPLVRARDAAAARLRRRSSTPCRLAKALDIGSVAEGIETLEQLEQVTRAGCNEAQGFYFSRPVPVGRGRRGALGVRAASHSRAA